MAKKDNRTRDSHPYQEVGERLIFLRNHMGLSVKDFAALCGFNYTRYLNWESGLRRPLPDEAADLCDKTGASLDFIYRGISAQLPSNMLKALSSKPRESA